MRFSHQLVPSRAGHIQIWDWPTEHGRYVIGADVSEGKVRDKVAVRRRIESMRERPDNSAAVVLEVETGDHVATWHGWENPLVFAHALYVLGMEYNQALLVPELNGPGTAVVEHLVRVLGYPNLYTTKLLARSEMTSQSDVMDFGWRTTDETRQDVMMRIHQRIADHSLRTRDKRLVKELRTLQYDDMGKPRAKGTDRDDIVIAYGLALRGRFELMVGTERASQEKPHAGPDAWVWDRKDQILSNWHGRSRPTPGNLGSRRFSK